MSEVVAATTASRRFNTLVLGLFAGLALLLATVGIYSVISYATALRTKEIGIRIVMGARPRDVFALVLGHGMKVTLIGVGAGLALAVGLTHMLSAMLFGVAPTDIMTFAGVSMLLFSVALLACYLPGRRATRVEPTTSLRYE
jgi:ABC-type antimicrobial peptide transport system permease subunit